MFTPESFFGFKPGSDRNMIGWDMLCKFYKKMQEETNRVLCIEKGKSTSGRPFLELIISAPENLALLDTYKEISKKLADPRGLSDDEISELAKTGKAVCMHTLSFHATECGPAQMAPNLVYELGTSNDEEILNILENVITIIIPSANPDGLDMVVSRYNKYKGTELDAVDHTKLWHKYSGYSSNRDMIFEQYNEGHYVSEIMFREWMPQAHVDHHHLWRNGPRMFVPPYSDPMTPECAPLLCREISLYGADMAYDLEEAKVPGVVSNAIFPLSGNTAYNTLVNYHNIASLLTESASARFASPTYMHPERLPQEPPSVFCPNPWKGGWWNFSDITKQQYIAAKSILKTMAKNKERILLNMANKGLRQTEAGAATKEKAFIIPVVQRDPSCAEKLIQLLDNQEIEYKITAENIYVDGCIYPEGTVIVPLNQPKYAMAVSMLKAKPFPEDCYSIREDGSIWVYCDSSECVAAMLGVKVIPAFANIEVKNTLATPKFARTEREGFLSGKENLSFKKVNALLKEGKKVYRDMESGDFYFENPPENAKEIKAARFGVYQTPWGCASTGGGVDAEGHARKVFDDYGFDYITVGPKDVREGALDNLDVLYIPDNLMGDLDGSNNYMKEALDEERDWLKGEDEEKLKAFVKRGGKVLAVSQAIKYIAKVFDLKITDKTSAHIPPNSFGRMSPNSSKLPHEPWFATKNSTLHTEVIPSEYTLGMAEECNVVHSAGFAFEIGEYFKPFLYKAYMRYPKTDVLADGLLQGEEYIAGTPALVGATYGEGEALLYGFNPTFRGWTENTYKTVFNALYK